MKYLRLELRYAPELMHPIHRLVDRSDAIDRDVLLHGTVFGGGHDSFLFYVEGDIDVYTAALESVDRVPEFEVTRVGETGYYVFLTQRRDETDEALFGSFRRSGVIVVPPVDFRPNGISRVTLIGDGERLRAALDDLPDEVGTDVLRIGEYDRRRNLFAPDLTERQFSAVTVAVEEGYYASPRETTVGDVAAELDCAPSTAAEHLRKAESAVMSTFMDLRTTVVER